MGAISPGYRIVKKIKPKQRLGLNFLTIFFYAQFSKIVGLYPKISFY